MIEVATKGLQSSGKPFTEQNFRYMRRTIKLARDAAKIAGASPIGCVIVRDGEVLAEGYNEVEIRHDPTAHAEIVTMQRAGRATGSHDLAGATLYSTLQPCGMCSMASIWGKIGRIVYGAGRDECIECILRIAILTRSISSPTPSETISPL